MGAGIGAALLGLLAGPGLAGAQDGPYRTFRPAGPGPFPTLLFVSGCSGFAPAVSPKAYERFAEAFTAQGSAVLFVDYLGRRNLKSCARAPITHAMGAMDLLDAATYVRSQAWADPGRITAMGWSWGGGIVLVALMEYAAPELGFGRAIVYYPDCRPVRPWKTAIPVLMLIGGEDEVAPGKACIEAAKRHPSPETVKVRVYPGAHHGFDVAELPAKTRYEFGTIGYHAAAAAAAAEEVRAFLKAGD